MLTALKRFFSDEAFFQRVSRGLLLAGALLLAQAQVMPGGLNWKNALAAGLALAAGSIAAPTKPV